MHPQAKNIRAFVAKLFVHPWQYYSCIRGKTIRGNTYLCAMNMLELNNQNQISEIDNLSASKPIIIFKHSTRCSISSAALNRFEKLYAHENTNELPVYYLDLIKHRDISNFLAAHYGVAHQSPQTLLIQNGKCTHHASHFEIDLSEIKSKL